MDSRVREAVAGVLADELWEESERELQKCFQGRPAAGAVGVGEWDECEEKRANHCVPFVQMETMVMVRFVPLKNDQNITFVCSG